MTCPCLTDEPVLAACRALSPLGWYELEFESRRTSRQGHHCCTRAAGHEGDHVRCAVTAAYAPTAHGAERWPQVEADADR